MFPSKLTNVLAITSADDSIIEQVKGWFTTIGDSFVDMFTAIPDAIGSFFEGYASTISGSWLGPILLAVGLGGAWLIYELFGNIKNNFFE